MDIQGGEAKPVAGVQGHSMRNPQLSAGSSWAVAKVGKELAQVRLANGK